MQQFLSTSRRRMDRAVFVLAGPCLAAWAWAQDAVPAGPPQPPTPVKPDDPPAILSFLLMILLVAATVFANAIPTKRGHQD